MPRHQTHHRPEVTRAPNHRWRGDRTQAAPLARAHPQAGSGHSRLPPAHPAVAGRLPVCPPARHPGADAIQPAPLPTTPSPQEVSRRGVSEADRGIQLASRERDTHDSQHIFDRVCDEHGIEHRLTKVNHPCTNGQVERMDRTLKDATIKRHHTGATTNCAPTSSFSWMPTATPAASKRCAASRPASSPAEPGPRSQNGSGLTRHTTPRD